MSEEMNDQMQVRRQKLQELYDLGIDPFGQKFDRLQWQPHYMKTGINLAKKNYMKKKKKVM